MASRFSLISLRSVSSSLGFMEKKIGSLAYSRLGSKMINPSSSTNGLFQSPSSFSSSSLKQYSTQTTAGDESDMIQFLSEEIQAEKGNLKSLPQLPQGFQVKQDGAELTFTKTHNSEKILITLNVNHTVDSAVPDDGSQEAPEMKSKPNFEVDIIKPGGKTLSFSCSFVHQDTMEMQAQEQEPNDDIFAIDEVTMYQDGQEQSPSNYAVAGDILDGYLYDMFMNMLEDRGVDGGFVQTLSDYCSNYEHSLYIRMLEDVSKFIKS